LSFVGQLQPAFLCEPGTCVAYSSTNYVLAGLILAAHSSNLDWTHLNQLDFYSGAVRAKLPDSFMYTTQMINQKLTVPGQAEGGWGGYPNTTIWNQSSTILGWTCGNLVATTQDVANFFWELLGPNSNLLPESTVTSMKKCDVVNTGWGKKFIAYGTGVMLQNYNYLHRGPLAFNELGASLGHGGDTYGFLSEQGLLYGLNASVSVAVNHDSPGLLATSVMCKIVKIAAKALLSKTLLMPCFGDADIDVFV